MSVSLDINEDNNSEIKSIERYASEFDQKNIKCIQCHKIVSIDDNTDIKKEYTLMQKEHNKKIQIKIDTELKEEIIPLDIVNLITKYMPCDIMCSMCKLISAHEQKFKQMYPNYTWDFEKHHESKGQYCGQSCTCCRARMGADFSTCDLCMTYKNC